MTARTPRPPRKDYRAVQAEERREELERIRKLQAQHRRVLADLEIRERAVARLVADMERAAS